MAVKIRLQRRGKTKAPVYRVVVQESRVARDGKVIEICGLYNPLKKPAFVQIDGDKVLAWIGKGAIPSKTVERLLVAQGIIAEPKPAIAPKKETPTKATTKKAAPVAAETPSV
jgi:small subunit ribosomal protein S16